MPKNPNCDNEYCVATKGEVRVLPTSDTSNAILCKRCFIHEMKWRYQRNKELSFDCRFDIPKWENLKIYEVN